ncbi:MAG: hypothetical protein KAI07_07790, partial [Deltaproteobacteria bacterium]|nr:hypothetical protein [Deltaproteobacteria bacterium]
TYPGTYSEFHYHQTNRETLSSLVINENENGTFESDDKPRAAQNKRKQAERRNRLYKELVEHGIENMENWEELSQKQLLGALSDLEKRIHSYEDKKVDLEGFLADPSNFQDKERASDLSHEYSELNNNIKKSYERWELVSAYIEAMRDHGEVG